MRSISKEKIVGLRNILSHEYAAIDPEAIFNTIKIGIPPLLTGISFIGNKMDRKRNWFSGGIGGS